MSHQSTSDKIKLHFKKLKKLKDSKRKKLARMDEEEREEYQAQRFSERPINEEFDILLWDYENSQLNPGRMEHFTDTARAYQEELLDKSTYQELSPREKEKLKKIEELLC